MSTIEALKGWEVYCCDSDGVLFGSKHAEIVRIEGVAVSAKQVVAAFLRDAVQPHLGGLLPNPLLEIIANLAAWPLLWS